MATKKADKQHVIGIPFQKGVSGNPKGRPRKEVCITTWLKEFADKSITAPIDARNLTYAQAAALSAWKAAAKGDLPEYNFIIERIEGKAISQIDVTSKGEQLKTNAVFNIVNPDTKILLARLESGEREPRLEPNTNLSSEPERLPIGQTNNSQ